MNANTDPGARNAARILKILAIVAGLVIPPTAAVISSVFTVGERQTAVVLRAGRYHRTVGPGRQVRLSFGIDRPYPVDTDRIHMESFGFRMGDRLTAVRSERTAAESSMITNEGYVIDVEWVVQYEIADASAYLFATSDPESILRVISEAE